MNTLATTEDKSVSAETMELVLGSGDLSKLTVGQRVELYAKICQTLGLNPFTRPFRFLNFQNQTVMYATKDATDQLRNLRKISIKITDQRMDNDLFIVTAHASTPDGRTDEDIGAVTLGKAMGDARANGCMRAITKAKRRVTLSIVGLGMLSEDELDTMPGAVTYDHEAPSPAPLRAAAAPTPRAARKTETDEKPTRTDEQWRVWIDKLRSACAVLYRRSEVVEIGDRPSVGDAIANGPAWVQREVSAILADNYKRFPEEPGDEPLDDLEIVGGDKLAAG